MTGEVNDNWATQLCSLTNELHQQICQSCSVYILKHLNFIIILKNNFTLRECRLGLKVWILESTTLGLNPDTTTFLVCDFEQSSSLYLSFLISQMGMIIVDTLWGSFKNQLNNHKIQECLAYRTVLCRRIFHP